MEKIVLCGGLFFFFKQKTAYEMRISDWSSDVCSSDLCRDHPHDDRGEDPGPDAADLDTVGDQGRNPEREQCGDQADTTRQRSRVVQCHAEHEWAENHEIGRASCRDSVCQSV